MGTTAANPADPSPELVASRANRRRRVRHRVHTPAYAALNSSCENTAIELQEIVNISEDGLAIQVAAPLQEQEKVDLCLDLTETGAKIEVRGQVVWLGSGKAGICFPEMPHDAQRQLKEWLFANAMAACEYYAGEQSAGTQLPEDQKAQPLASELSASDFDGASFPADYTATLAALEAVRREIVLAGAGCGALQLIAERAMALTRATGAAIALTGESGLICRATAGQDAPGLGMRFNAGEGFSGECVSAGQTLRCDDTETDPRVDKRSCRALGIRSMIATPIRGRASILGLLEVFSPQPNSFHLQDEATLQRLAEMASEAVHPVESDEKGSPPASATIVGEEVAAEIPEKSGSYRLSLSHGLLLITAAITLIAAVVWLFAPWNFGIKSALTQGQRQAQTSAKSAAAPAGPQDFAGLRQLAEKGDPAAQFAVGAHYATGEDVPQDYTEALRWFTLAAEQGHVGAQATLGAYYWSGRGAPPDLSKAYFWAVLAQNGGDDASRYRVAFLASRMTHAQIIAAQQRADEWTKTRQSVSPSSRQRD